MVRAQMPKIYICIMILYWVTTTTIHCVFYKLIYDYMQLNNWSVLTYDGAEQDFTATPWG